MKNWKLFIWAIKRLEIENNDCRKSLKNNFLLWLMDISGVTYLDVYKMCHEIKNELDRRGSA